MVWCGGGAVHPLCFCAYIPQISYWRVSITTGGCLSSTIADDVTLDAAVVASNSTALPFGYKFTGLSLTPQAAYFACVRAYTVAGVMGSAASHGVIIDQTPPVPGALHVPEAIAVTTELVVCDISWDAWTDDESEINFYQVYL